MNSSIKQVLRSWAARARASCYLDGVFKASLLALSMLTVIALQPASAQTVTRTTLSASPNPATAGQAVTLSAVVTGLNVTGTVQFLDGSTVLGTGTITSGVASLSTTFTTTGTHSLSAVYSGDGANAGSTATGLGLGSVSLLLHMDGASGAHSFVDSSANAHVATTIAAGATNDTGNAKFGASSGYFNGGYLWFDDSPDWAMGSGDFTAETWVKFSASAMGTRTFLYSQNSSNGANHTFGVGKTTGDRLTAFTGTDGTSVSLTGATPIQANVWYHLALVRSGGTETLYLNGNVEASAPISGSVQVSHYHLGVGVLGEYTASSPPDYGTLMLGWLDDFRITKGVAVYTAPFTPPTAALPDPVMHVVAAPIGSGATTTTLSSATNPAAVNANVVLTATVTGSSPSGTVTFYDAGTSLGSATLSAGVASRTVSFASVGSHALTAAYGGDSVNATSTSTSIAQAVQGASTTSLSVAPTSAYQSQSVVLTATITGSSPTGTVTFNDTTTGATASWGPVTVVSGRAVANVTFAATGTHTLTATYAGDSTNQASTSTVVSEPVNAKYATTSTLTSATSTPQIGVPLTLSSTVTSSGSGAGVSPTGSVTFMDGAATACSGALNASRVATCSWTPTSQGTHSLTAVYAGDTADTGSTSAAVSTTVGINSGAMTLSPSANPGFSGRSLTLVASIAGYAPTGTVQFTDGGASLGAPVTVVGGQASFAATPATATWHVYGANYVGDVNNAARSATANVNVLGDSSATSISTSASAVTPTTPVTFTATVTGVSPTGSVTFRDGAVVLHTATLVSGTATWSQSLATGLHVVTANYGGDTNNSASTSTAALVQASADGSVQPPAAALQTNFEYDAQGNLTKITDANSAITRQAYDSLQRGTTITQPVPAAGQAAPVIGIAYDLQDQPASVTDPRSLSTSYTVDGLGNATAQTSPDTGTTTRTFYDNGLLKTSTDARGKVATYTYDALDRVKTVAYSDASPGITYGYDAGTYGVGHLTSVADESGSTSFVYDGLGRIVTKTQVSGPAGAQRTFVMSYAWGTSGTAAGKLQTVTYPSGASVTYGYDPAGRVDDVSVTGADGVVTKVLTGVSYTALSQIGGWLWGTGAVVYQRGFDAYGRLVSYPLGNPNGSGMSAGVTRTLGFDAAGRIVGYSHTTPANWDQVFSYDGLDRLTGANLVGGNTYGYAYDATGNRTQSTVNATTYALTVSPTSNQYTNVATAAGATNAQGFDAAGHLTSEGQGGTYSYSARGRLSSETRSSGNYSYLYNAFEQRTYKSGPSAVITTGTAYYAYDETGHLVGEYDANGKAIYETVYLGDMPVASLTQPAIGQTTVSYVYADHLNTARVIVRPADQAIVWSWGSNEPFGQSQANSNPNGLGVYTYNPRFPGQVADAESGWFYNWHRDYNPALGRYTESDPIGLGGGTNTYGYVLESPLGYFDSNGLQISAAAGGTAAGGGAAAAGAYHSGTGGGLSASSILNSETGGGRSRGRESPDEARSRPRTCPETPPPDCDELKKRVRDAKDWMGDTYQKGTNPSSCAPGMTKEQLTQRAADWLTLAQARSHRDQVCYAGGDGNHQNEQAAAWMQVSNCQNLLRGL